MAVAHLADAGVGVVQHAVAAQPLRGGVAVATPRRAVADAVDEPAAWQPRWRSSGSAQLWQGGCSSNGGGSGRQWQGRCSSNGGGCGRQWHGRCSSNGAVAAAGSGRAGAVRMARWRYRQRCSRRRACHTHGTGGWSRSRLLGKLLPTCHTASPNTRLSGGIALLRQGLSNTRLRGGITLLWQGPQQHWGLRGMALLWQGRRSPKGIIRRHIPVGDFDHLALVCCDLRVGIVGHTRAALARKLARHTRTRGARCIQPTHARLQPAHARFARVSASDRRKDGR
jgi:hypothetical protein